MADDNEEIVGSDAGDSGEPDISVYEAAIAERDAIIANKDAEIAAKDAEIQAQKAANYDLLKSVPGNETVETVTEDDNSGADFDDFFGKKD